MVPRPAEKRGGLGKGLTTLSRKKQIVTKTSTKGTLLNLGEGGPPGESMPPCSESRKEATSPISFLSYIKNQNMERENHVRSKQSSPNSKGTTGLQHHSIRAM